MRRQTLVRDARWGVSATTSTAYEGAVLNIYRFPLGYGRASAHGDADGKTFPDREDADAFCVVHGYLFPYRTAPSMRLRRILRGQGFGHSYEAAVHSLDERDVAARIARWNRSKRVPDLFPSVTPA